MSVKEIILIISMFLFYIIGFVFGIYVKEKDYEKKRA